MTDNTQPALSPGTYTIKIQNTIQAVESHSEPTPIITSPSPLDLPPNDPDRDGDGDGLSRLCENFGVLRLPESQLVESTDESAQWLNDKLRNGYALVKTRDQTGAATMAVCRGPLIPFPGQESSAVRGKDLAIIDERTGIRDISYQVTWQLGREVLMKDHSLVISLVRLKRKIFEEVKKRVAACSGTEDHELVMREITSVIKECFGFDNTPPDDDATAIQRFISEAHQTSNITQSHLITDPDMLPLESIRTFYTDQSWIEAFLDGGLHERKIARPNSSLGILAED
ncbi:hypothetical protein QBC38DRAFT_455722 [Podospora fimiseda]|uniref:Uncharacterized protein n=1 Tax=Podospora fimiseda TaxID=252190 RepID=A0AAN7H1U2_9PEZI|nr:hypothetical protein QBC38DRAFT_455722 [Podospora fimiseda]